MYTQTMKTPPNPFEYLQSNVDAKFEELKGMILKLQSILEEKVRQQEEAEMYSEEDRLDVHAAVKLLKDIVPTEMALYQRAHRGTIPHRKLGNKLFFSRIALTRWIQNKEL